MHLFLDCLERTYEELKQDRTVLSDNEVERLERTYEELKHLSLHVVLTLLLV